MPNPYTLLPVDHARYFDPNLGGRGTQAERTLDNLRRVEPRPNPISLIGERRFGKSSLLAYLERAVADSPHLLTASIDLLELSPQTPEGFYAALTESLILNGTLPEDSPPLTFLTFRRFLAGLRRTNQALILFIDEFDLVTRDRRFDRTFFDNLRSAVTRYPLTLVVASVAPLADMAHQDVFTSPFWNVFFKEQLGPLSRSEAIALIEQGGSPDGLGGATNEIIELAGLHPFFLQLVCSLAWDLRATQGRLDLDQLRTAFTSQIRDHYQYIWEHSDGQEQQALCAFVAGERPDGAGFDRLTKRGYMLAADPPQLCGAGFAAFVCEQCAAQAAAQPRGQPAPEVAPVVVPGLLNPIRVNVAAQEQRLAFVIGLNTYRYQQAGDYILPSLQFAERDAIEMSLTLEKSGFQVTQLLGMRATNLAVQNQFDQFSQLTSADPHPDSCFVFHFAGHGMIDPRHNETAHLILYDTDPNDPRATGLEMNHLVYHLLPKVRVPNTLVLLDACHAGFAAGVRDLHPNPNRLSNVAQQIFGIVRGRMVLAACPGEAQARELATLGQGVFTNYVLRHWRDLDGSHPVDSIDSNSLVGYVFTVMPQNHPTLPQPVWGGAGVGPPLILRHILRAPAPGV
jgi:hypothetical protein